MIAIDTNILVRCLTLDDPAQVPAAKTLLAHADGVFIAKTTLLELEWVLRAAYKVPRSGIHTALTCVLGLPNVCAENETQVARALQGYGQGLGFADALHLASSPAEEGFFTFDEKFVQLATASGHKVVLASALEPAP
jgi:predicted nucleic-acid-binding protein